MRVKTLDDVDFVFECFLGAADGSRMRPKYFLCKCSAIGRIFDYVDHSTCAYAEFADVSKRQYAVSHEIVMPPLDD
jgi:hypothetical protein